MNKEGNFHLTNLAEGEAIYVQHNKHCVPCMKSFPWVKKLSLPCSHLLLVSFAPSDIFTFLWHGICSESEKPGGNRVNIKTNIFVFVFIMYSNHITCSYLKGNYKCQQMWPQNFFDSTKLKVDLIVVTSSLLFNDLFVRHFYEINFILRLFGNG